MPQPYFDIVPVTTSPPYFRFWVDISDNSDKQVLSEEEIQAQIKQIDLAINKAFIAVQEREISEKQLLADASDRRKVEVQKLDKALKDEMEAKSNAQITMKKAERESKKYTK